MSLNPERYPVTVYKSTDVDAQQIINGNAGNFRLVAKECLLKKGWSVPFESIEEGIVVLRPPLTAEQDFYLHISDDNGRQANIKVYTDMTTINDGILKIELGSKYQYGDGIIDGKWLLIATERGFWFFNSFLAINSIQQNQTGSHFYCGDTASNSKGERGLYLKHSGGSYTTEPSYYGYRESIFSTDAQLAAVGVLTTSTHIDNDTRIETAFAGDKNLLNGEILTHFYIVSNSEMYVLPCFGSSRNDKPNYHEQISVNRSFINHAHNTYGKTHNFYIPTDYWEL